MLISYLCICCALPINILYTRLEQIHLLLILRQFYVYKLELKEFSVAQVISSGVQDSLFVTNLLYL